MDFIEFFTTGSTRWFTIAIGAALILGLFVHSLGKGGQRLSLIMPSLCTQIGILGTFFGIAMALLGIGETPETSDLNKLIGGIRTSVWSSVAGFTAFILLKIRVQLIPDEEDPEDASRKLSETSGSIIAAVDGFKDELREQIRTQHEADQQRAEAAEAAAKSDREAIAQVISDLKGQAEQHHGEAQNWILEEHDKTRDSIRDLQESGKAGMKDLVDSFRQFQKTMSEEIIKGLMASLKDAFETFNDQLAKHVGGNFEKLNEIVGNLGRWQENWKDHVDKGAEALNAATESLRESAGQMTTIAERLTAVAGATETIPGDVKALIEIHGALKERAEEMAARAQDLRESSQQAIDEAVRALKTAQASLEEGTNTAEEIRESLRNSLRTAQETLQNSLDEVRQALQNSMQSANAALNTALGEARESLSGSVQDARNALSGSLEESQQSLRESMNESQSAFRSTLDEIGEALKNSADTLNQAINTQITERVQEMAEILAGIIDTLNERVQAMEGESQ